MCDVDKRDGKRQFLYAHFLSIYVLNNNRSSTFRRSRSNHLVEPDSVYDNLWLRYVIFAGLVARLQTCLK